MSVIKLKRKHIVWGHVIFWIIEHFIGFSFYIFSRNPVSAEYYIGRALSSLVWMMAFYISYFFIVPIIIKKGEWLNKIVKIVTIYLVFVVLDSYYIRLLNVNYFGSEPLPYQRYLLNAFSYSTSYMIMGGVFRLAINGLNTIFQKSQLEKQNLKSELAFLRSQINPHFLFNTLNNMHSFAQTDPDKTAFSIIKLSEIMRYMLNESSSDKVLLEQEIEYIKSYIALQNLRFSDKEFVYFNIIGDPTGIEIAPMIFIPFVENAFKHGDKKQKDKGINIKLEVLNSKVIFEVSNLKRKIRSEEIENSSGFGLVNLERRLELTYPGNYNLEKVEKNDLYITKLEINFRNEN